MHILSEENHIETYFTPKALAQRWNVTLHTLEQWRWKGHGPRFFKAGGSVRYPRQEIEKFEASVTHSPTVDLTDKRFLCIDLESLVARQEEDKAMGP